MKQVYLVDDDPAIRDALAWQLQAHGLQVSTWPSAEAFLEAYDARFRGCLVLDIRMSGMSGTELYERLVASGCTMPTIFMTGHGDIPLAVRMLKQGAFDFIEKPCGETTLLDRIHEALALEAKRCSASFRQTQLEAALERLTSREKEVMQGILAGKMNKVIAAELDIAMRTVEVHRARIFEKMGVKSAVELAGMLGSKNND